MQGAEKLIIETMVQRAMKKEMQRRNTDHRQGGENTNKDPHPDDHHRPGNATMNHVDFAFEGLYDTESEFEQKDEDDIYENSVRVRCVHQLEAYDQLSPMQMKDKFGNYNDPMKLWKENESQFPELKQLAIEFLSIPATSAPSKRVWSRASRVISAKRSKINPEVTSRMIFAQENV